MPSTLRGTLRLEPAHPVLTRDMAEPGAPSGGGGDASYYNKLITLFPAEALTLYGTGVAVFVRSTLAALVVCLVVLVLLRSVATEPQQGGRPHYEAVIVAAISFILWTTATDPGWMVDARLKNLDLQEVRKWAAFLGGAFVLLAPVFIQPPSPAPANP
jgi:hypothetical protein